MKKILVTGATGFIGNYVVKYLLENDYHVIATSSNEKKAETFSWFNSVTYVPFNLSAFDTKENYFQFFNQPDILIHLAWEGLPNYKSAFHVDVNLPRHIVFLKNLISNGLLDVTITGTCLEYGMQEGCLSEEMPVFPSTAYAIAKNKLCEELQHLQKQYPFHLKWVRLFYLYGKGQNPNSLLSQLEKALANGEQTFNMSGGKQLRDYLAVDKAAEYIAKIALQNGVEGVVNCCSGKPVSIKEFVENYLREKKKTISLNLGYYPYSDYEPMQFWGDTKKLKTILNEQ